MNINLAFFKAEYGGLFAKLIKWKTKGIHSHVEMIFPDYVVYDEKRNRELSLCFSSYEKEGGVRFKFIYLDPKKWDIVPVEIPDDKPHELMVLASSLTDAGYDWFGIVGFVLPHVPERPDRFFCSEVVVYVLQQAVGILLDLVSYKTSPAQLFLRITENRTKVL